VHDEVAQLGETISAVQAGAFRIALYALTSDIRRSIDNSLVPRRFHQNSLTKTLITSRCSMVTPSRG
jgi:hypothetical protein